MKEVIFILAVISVLSSCKKDKLGGNSIFAGCPEMYDYRSEPLNMNIYDSVRLIYTQSTDCIGWEAENADTIFSFFKINPKNAYEIICLVRYPQNSSYSLIKYNFCSNVSTTVIEDMINYNFDVSSKGWILFVLGPGEHIYKVKLNGEGLTELPYFPTLTSSVDIPIWNPSGELFISGTGEVYNADGEPTDTVDFNEGQLIGWYDNTHVLTSKQGNTSKVNINSGLTNIFISESFTSYDYGTDRFLKKVDSLDYQKWNIYNNNGYLISSTNYHFLKSINKGGELPPQFLSEDKMIMNLITKEFYPNPHTISCFLLRRYRIAIECLNSNFNVRKVNFPE